MFSLARLEDDWSDFLQAENAVKAWQSLNVSQYEHELAVGKESTIATVSSKGRQFLIPVNAGPLARVTAAVRAGP